ncbi:LysM domain-containing protein [Thiothrix caldifontis]|uniref:LysM domain-containing protein n=1 Tax=Thiothrix caldifontis TaxID=525918 RepID=A0A1H4FXT6_9GAMM|nr:LysM peptidoglycan-binding domain-containing protein [Thiothrix caldifontis]SEB02104.1 LysM domain-containing protein [Thiothrix caldifontis]
MTKTFMLLAGAVLMLWFIGVCETVPVISVGVTLGGVPYKQQSSAPVNASVSCQQWHVVGPGETQWAIATRYAGYEEKHQWLRQARRVSGLAADDPQLKANQVLCVAW